MNGKIFVSFEIEGIHRHEKELLPEYDYLKNRHRHVFHVKLFVDVKHDDREIEFIKLKEDLMKLYVDQPCEFNDLTAEDIARKIFNNVKENFPVLHGRNCTVVVSEDNENGGIYCGIL